MPSTRTLGVINSSHIQALSYPENLLIGQVVQALTMLSMIGQGKAANLPQQSSP